METKDPGDFDVVRSLERKNPSTAPFVEWQAGREKEGGRGGLGEEREKAVEKSTKRARGSRGRDGDPLFIPRLRGAPLSSLRTASATSGIDEIDCGGCISKRGPALAR